jgi:hypothetical protein
MATTLTSTITELDIARLKKEIESLGNIRVISVNPPTGSLPTTVVLTQGDKISNLTETQETDAQEVLDAHVSALDKSAKLIAKNKVVIGTLEAGEIQFDTFGNAWKIDESKNLVPHGAGLRSIGSPTNPVNVIYANEVVGAEIGGGGPGGLGGDAVYNEVPVGQVNGVNTVYFTINDFLAGSTRVFVNGVRLTLGEAKGYTETDTNQITLSFAPLVGDEILVDYTPIA